GIRPLLVFELAPNEIAPSSSQLRAKQTSQPEFHKSL
ncbi:hypothetical protein L195_g009794, partial [Trifolium pratense]